MGAKQSAPALDARTRAYSSSDLPSGDSGAAERIAGFRYTNGPDGPRIRYTGGGGPASSGMSIPAGGRSESHNQSLDGTDGDEGQLGGPEAHRLLIGSLPSHLSPRLLGGKTPQGPHQKGEGLLRNFDNIFISLFPCFKCSELCNIILTFIFYVHYPPPPPPIISVSVCVPPGSKLQLVQDVRCFDMSAHVGIFPCDM